MICNFNLSLGISVDFVIFLDNFVSTIATKSAIMIGDWKHSNQMGRISVESCWNSILKILAHLDRCGNRQVVQAFYEIKSRGF